jgi:hypothetical protein
MRGCQYSCWPIALRRMTTPAWRLLIWFSGESFAYPVTSCSELPQTKYSQQRTMSPTWWSDYTTPTTTPGDTWGWPGTAWRYGTIAWPIRPDSRKATESGCTARPGADEGHQSCSRHGKARTRSSPGSTMSSTEFSGTPGREWWWYTWTDWRRTWGLFGTSSLKDWAMWHIRFPW